MHLLKLFLIIFITSCGNSSLKESKNPSKETVVNLDGRTNERDTLSMPDLNYRKITKQLGLEVLPSPRINEEYRLWIEDASEKKNILIVLKMEAGEWIAYKYLFKANHNEKFEVTNTEFTLEKAQPKSGSSGLEAKIKELRTYAFRNLNEIKDYEDCNGTFGLVLETQKGLEYKKCLYPCWTFAKKIKDVEILKNLFKICIDEFGFTFYEKVYRE